MKPVHVLSTTLSCLVGFENNLAQMIITTKQCVIDKNHVISSKVIHCKKIRIFYGKIPGNQLPVHIPLVLRASACKTFLEIKKW